MFSSPTLIFVTDDFSLFHFIGKWNEQKEIPWWNWNIYLRRKKKCRFEKEISKKVVLSENVFKVLAVAVFMVRGILLIKDFYVLDTQMIDLKFCTHSSNRLLHKSVSTIFLIMTYSALPAILWQILKSHFERKQSKTDYPKNIWKEEKCVHGFFWVLVMCISVRKNYIKPHMCWCRSS